MKVLIACEFSGTVREAFAALGHDAWSCDLEPTEIPGKHYQGDVTEILNAGWDLMVAHPPCTHLAVSGAKYFGVKNVEQIMALNFVQTLMDAPIVRIAIENPVSVISTKIRKPDQIIQPCHFGHNTTKKNLSVAQKFAKTETNKRSRARIYYRQDFWKTLSKMALGNCKDASNAAGA